jgi:glycosyltransferase involved in cell wall biosynthesis
MDVFILSSLIEASPVALLEAMSCARPVVATQVGGIPELVLDGKTGILVPPKNPDALAKATLDLLTHTEKAKDMGLQGRQWVKENFDITICAEKHRQIYEHILSS